MLRMESPQMARNFRGRCHQERMKYLGLLLTLTLSLQFIGCTAVDYGYTQPSVERQLLSISSIDGRNFYKLFEEYVRSYCSADSFEKLKELGRPEYIFSVNLRENFLVFKDPLRVIQTKEKIGLVGSTIEFTEFDYIPEDFRSEVLNSFDKKNIQANFNINESKIGMDRQDWLSKVNYASLAFAEEDLVCYRAGLQFYYFKNDKLVRVDEGVSEENINLNIRHLEE